MKKRDPHSVGMKGTPHFSNRVVRCLEVGGKEDKKQEYYYISSILFLIKPTVRGAHCRFNKK